MSDAVEIRPVDGPLDADVPLPGSKSLTNRALVCAALASGRSRLDGALFADDTEALLEALGALGVGLHIDRSAARVEVEGVDGRLPPGPAALDVRMSGTTARFLPPMLALGPGPYRVDAAPQMRRRPMAPTIDALRRLGVRVREEGEPGHLPLTIEGGAGVHGGEVDVTGDVSSQFLSGLLLAAPYVPGGLAVDVRTDLVSVPYVDMTTSTMGAFGVTAERPGPGRYRVLPGRYRATEFAIEPDATAASYFFAAAAICGGTVRVRGLGRDALQGDVRFVDVLERMGATVEWGRDTIAVTGTGRLRGVELDLGDISDTAQTLATVAAFAEGPTRVTGIGFIRRKETDRIAAVVTELRRCGVGADEEPDGFVVRPAPPRPATVQTYDDHRMAMSFALLGLRAPGIRIADPGCVAKTFPDFFERLAALR